MPSVDVGSIEDLWSGEKRVVVAGGKRILLVQLGEFGETLRAYDDTCQHLGMSFETGLLADGVLRCAFHAWEYDARDGSGRNPKGVCLRRFGVSVRDGRILVDVGEAGQRE